MNVEHGDGECNAQNFIIYYNLLYIRRCRVALPIRQQFIIISFQPTQLFLFIEVLLSASSLQRKLFVFIYFLFEFILYFFLWT